MNASKIIILFIAVILGIIFIYSIKNVEVEDKYQSKIQKERDEKNEEFKNGDDSPLTEEEKSEFKGLNYYPINKRYIVEAQFMPNPLKETIQLSYSDGSEKLYLKYGTAIFTLDGKEQSLLILKPTFYENEEYLFLPFYDETSALETYGGGRYIDLDTDVKNTIKIDFNQAYNPYCAYNANYRCPIPPRENKITVPIEAGEKKFDLTH